MRVHTNGFKNNINIFGREIQGKLIYYQSFDLISESNDNILTESNLQLISEQANYNDPIEINREDISSISIIKNGNLLQSLMKELDFESKVELNIGSVVNPQLGVLVDEDYEYLDYGNFIINSKEFNMDTETWNYVCFDKMLFSMVKYRGINSIEYPITIKEYINKLCDKVGLEFEDSTFVNQSQLIYEDLYKNRDVTYRDIFDEISKIVAGNLMIDDNDKLKVGYPTQTNDTINGDYLKDTNVRMAEKVGVINSVAILDTENNLQYLAEDTQSIKENQMTRVTITNNLIAMNGDTQEIADNILNKLNGLYYYLNDFQTIGVCYYDFLDMFNVEARGNTYQCLLLNNEITITQGIEEHIFTEKLEELETSKNEYTTSIISNKAVQFRINQQKGELESKVEKDGVISAINQSAEEIQIKANKISLEGKEINLTSDNVVIESTNFSVDRNGNLTCNDATMNDTIMNNATANNLKINGGKINLTANYYSDQRFTLEYNDTNNNRYYKNAISPNGMIVYDRDDNNKYAYYESSGFNAKSNDGRYRLNNYATGITIYKNNYSTIDISGDGNITCVSLTQTSLKEKKKNFEKLTNAKEILNATDIYKYNFKEEDDSAKKSIGFVIGEGFNYSKEITSESNDGANIYSMVAVLWQVVKEQQEEINELKEMIKNGKH